MAGLMKSSMMVVMMMIMVASMQMQSATAQTRHVVGDALGWTIPSNGAAAYTTWASQQTFRVGDTLFFNFTTGMHNVAEVSQAAYGPCTTTNPISLTPTGPATITLTAAGTHYYICTVGTHCQIGQKLTVNVTAPATAPTPPPAAAPATPPTTSPPAATPTPTPTPAPVSPPAATPAPATAPTTSPAAAPTTPPAATPTATGPSPPSPTATGPSPDGDVTPSPPSPSAASTAVVPATLLAFALALFF